MDECAPGRKPRQGSCVTEDAAVIEGPSTRIYLVMDENRPMRCVCCGLSENQFSGRVFDLPNGGHVWYCDICIGRGHHLPENLLA